MSTSSHLTALARAFLPAVLALCAGIGGAQAQKSEDQILRALTPPQATRSLSSPSAADTAASQTETKFIDSIRNRATRSLTSSERQQIFAVASTKPQIDIEINFDLGSADIARNAISQVDTLGRALTNADLKNSTFLLAGHTDARGAEDYNQGLSERRADTIKRYLMDKYGLRADQLVTAGYGRSRLKNGNNPYADENRRVQVVNMQGNTASNNR